jgi:diphosphomevalonate decarboxylase
MVMSIAPVNVALSKYWGKRFVKGVMVPSVHNVSLTLPLYVTVSLRIAAYTTAFYNGKCVGPTVTQQWCNRLRILGALSNYTIEVHSAIPPAAGVAFSAGLTCAFMRALNTLHDWSLSVQACAQRASQGSGSAGRSFWPGFVAWHTDGTFTPLMNAWQNLCVGIAWASRHVKHISSKQAMLYTQQHAVSHAAWLAIAHVDCLSMQDAILNNQWPCLGILMERHSDSFHALLASVNIVYHLPKTIRLKRRVYQARQAGVQVYYTQDAGPNLKLLWLDNDTPCVKQWFPNIVPLKPSCIAC